MVEVQLKYWVVTRGELLLVLAEYYTFFILCVLPYLGTFSYSDLNFYIQAVDENHRFEILPTFSTNNFGIFEEYILNYFMPRLSFHSV